MQKLLESGRSSKAGHISLPKRDATLKERIVIGEDRETIGILAARKAFVTIQNVLIQRRECPILFASAPSQHATWRELVRLFKELPDQLRRSYAARIHAFHMDEYLGLPDAAPQLFGKVLEERVFSELGIPQQNIFRINPRLAREAAQQLMQYQGSLESDEGRKLFTQLTGEVRAEITALTKAYMTSGGRFELVIGGIGVDPHLAFNDPPKARFGDRALLRVVELSPESRQQQVTEGEFSKLDEVPRFALTWTLPPIFSGKEIIIVVHGAHKAHAVARTLDGEITETVPASGLKLPKVLQQSWFFLDREAVKSTEITQDMPVIAATALR